MPKFHILRMDREGTPPIMRNGIPRTFTDPQEAQEYCKAYATDLGEKLCVKAVVDDEWRKREEKRFRGDDYRHLPWAGNGWWATEYPIWKDHYPHASLKKPGWIAYTKSPEDGVKDKQSMLRPGAYLNKYFAKAMVRHGLREKLLVDQFMAMYGEINIKFAATEAEIEKVYAATGQMTCVYVNRYAENEFPGRIYGFGDLQIAYIGDMNGKVSARCLVWPERKLHSRVYGDIARLQSGLERLGYKWGAPIGAKIKRIQVNEPEYKNGRVPQNCFVAPYIDKKNQAGGGHLGVLDRKTHLEICLDNTPGSHHCGLPDGYSGSYVPRPDEAPMFTCDCCERQGPDLLHTVYVEDFDDGEFGESQHWCRRCIQATAFQCRYSGEYFFTNNVKQAIVAGNYWAKYYADMYAARCEGSGALYPERDLLEVHFPDGTKKKLSQDWCRVKLGGIFRSDLTNRIWSKLELISIFGDWGHLYHCAKAELAYHGFKCDECETHWMLSNRVQENDKLFCPSCWDKKHPPKEPQPYKLGTSTTTTAVYRELRDDMQQAVELQRARMAIEQQQYEQLNRLNQLRVAPAQQAGNWGPLEAPINPRRR